MEAIWVLGFILVGGFLWFRFRDPEPKTEADFFEEAEGQSADTLAAQIEVCMAYGRQAQAKALAKAAQRRFPDDARFLWKHGD